MGSSAGTGSGVYAFLAFFLLAIALWLLVRNMNARMRRMAYRERERLEQDERKAAEGDASDSADNS